MQARCAPVDRTLRGCVRSYTARQELRARDETARVEGNIAAPFQRIQRPLNRRAEHLPPRSDVAVLG
eukprot:2708274-Rhodomonas_salina.2